MDNYLTILCDICKKNPFEYTIEVHKTWLGVCKKCKEKIEKKKEIKNAKIYMR